MQIFQPLVDLIPLVSDVPKEPEASHPRMIELEVQKNQLLEINERKTIQMKQVLTHLRLLTNEISLISPETRLE